MPTNPPKRRVIKKSCKLLLYSDDKKCYNLIESISEFLSQLNNLCYYKKTNPSNPIISSLRTKIFDIERIVLGNKRDNYYLYDLFSSSDKASTNLKSLSKYKVFYYRVFEIPTLGCIYKFNICPWVNYPVCFNSELLLPDILEPYGSKDCQNDNSLQKFTWLNPNVLLPLRREWLPILICDKDMLAGINLEDSLLPSSGAPIRRETKPVISYHIEDIFGLFNDPPSFRAHKIYAIITVSDFIHNPEFVLSNISNTRYAPILRKIYFSVAPSVNELDSSVPEEVSNITLEKFNDIFNTYFSIKSLDLYDEVLKHKQDRHYLTSTLVKLSFTNLWCVIANS